MPRLLMAAGAAWAAGDAPKCQGEAEAPSAGSANNPARLSKASVRLQADGVKKGGLLTSPEGGGGAIMSISNQRLSLVEIEK
jgi:hypothetical protein